MRALLRANASMLFSLARRAVRGAALSMASIPAAQGQEPVSLDLPGERARGLDGGVEHAREILPPERRLRLPPSRRDEINSRRTQEFLASFGQLGAIFIQLLIVTGADASASCAIARFGFVPLLWPKRSGYFPSRAVPSCNCVSPQHEHVAKRDRSRYPHDLSQSADPS